MADLEEWIEHIMIPGGLYGAEPVWRKVISRGKSNRALIMKIDRKIHALDLDADDYQEQYDALMAERRTLKGDRGQQADKTKYEDTGLTVADYWPTIDTQAQREFLLTAGIKLANVERVEHGAGYRVNADMRGPWPIKFIMVEGGGLNLDATR